LIAFAVTEETNLKLTYDFSKSQEREKDRVMKKHWQRGRRIGGGMIV
jgi:hypothetical protein